jgi:drug/metabolite transporter (DMT)-like permease
MKSPSDQFKHQVLTVHLPLFVVQVLYTIIPTFSKIAFKSFSPQAVVFFRITVSALLFGIIFFFFLYEKVQRKTDFLYFAVLACFGVAANQLLFLKGVSLTKAANASILITTIPIFTLIIAGILKQEKITLKKSLGLICAFIGVSVLINIGNFQFEGVMKGNLLILANSFFFSIYLVLSKPILKRYKPFTVITWIFIFGAGQIILLILTGVINPVVKEIFVPQVMALLSLVIFSTFFVYLLNALILKRIAASLVAMYTYIQPLAGTLLAVLVLKEGLSLNFFVSAVLIMIGVTIVSRSRR